MYYATIPILRNSATVAEQAMIKLTILLSLFEFYFWLVFFVWVCECMYDKTLITLGRECVRVLARACVRVCVCVCAFSIFKKKRNITIMVSFFFCTLCTLIGLLRKKRVYKSLIQMLLFFLSLFFFFSS